MGTATSALWCSPRTKNRLKLLQGRGHLTPVESHVPDVCCYQEVLLQRPAREEEDTVESEFDHSDIDDECNESATVENVKPYQMQLVEEFLQACRELQASNQASATNETRQQQAELFTDDIQTSSLQSHVNVFRSGYNEQVKPTRAEECVRCAYGHASSPIDVCSCSTWPMQPQCSHMGQGACSVRDPYSHLVRPQLQHSLFDHTDDEDDTEERRSCSTRTPHTSEQETTTDVAFIPDRLLLLEVHCYSPKLQLFEGYRTTSPFVIAARDRHLPPPSPTTSVTDHTSLVASEHADHLPEQMPLSSICCSVQDGWPASYPIMLGSEYLSGQLKTNSSTNSSPIPSHTTTSCPAPCMCNSPAVTHQSSTNSSPIPSHTTASCPAPCMCNLPALTHQSSTSSSPFLNMQTSTCCVPPCICSAHAVSHHSSTNSSPIPAQIATSCAPACTGNGQGVTAQLSIELKCTGNSKSLQSDTEQVSAKSMDAYSLDSSTQVADLIPSHSQLPAESRLVFLADRQYSVDPEGSAALPDQEQAPMGVLPTIHDDVVEPFAVLDQKWTGAVSSAPAAQPLWQWLGFSTAAVSCY